MSITGTAPEQGQLVSLRNRYSEERLSNKMIIGNLHNENIYTTVTLSIIGSGNGAS